ncbi:MAG TPA: glycosyltransferase [Burkholderiales bacterium]|nr:glycosyltransferase [Burkholderiales bacterium]
MRILMLSDVYFPRVNGVSTSIQTFRRQLAQLGHETLLIAPEYGGGSPADDEPGILRIPSHQILFDPEDRRMELRRILRHLPELRQRQFDLIHIQTPFVAHYAGVALSARLGLPRVETYHTLFEEYLYHYVPFVPKAWMRAMARRFSRNQCNNLDALVVPSSAVRQVLRAYGVTVPTEVIPTGIELERLAGGDGSAFRARSGIAPGRPTLVHVGRVAFEKNIDFLLRVLVRVRERIPGVLLVISGEGPASQHLRRLARRLGLSEQVLFVGYQERTQALLDCYRAGDVFVFASRTETQGLVLLEAMALGVPVVAAAILGTKDILDPGKGALVAELREDDFAAKIVTLLEDKALRERLGREAQDYVREWAARRMAERMSEFYGRLHQHRPRAAVDAVRAAATGPSD